MLAGAAQLSAGTADGVHGDTALATTVAATDAPHEDAPAGGPGSLSAAADVRALALGLIRQLAGGMGDMAQLLEALGGVAARLPGPATPDDGPGGGQDGDALPSAALDCLLAAAGAAAALPREVRGAWSRLFSRRKPQYVVVTAWLVQDIAFGLLTEELLRVCERCPAQSQCHGHGLLNFSCPLCGPPRAFFL